MILEKKSVMWSWETLNGNGSYKVLMKLWEGDYRLDVVLFYFGVIIGWGSVHEMSVGIVERWLQFGKDYMGLIHIVVLWSVLG